MVSFAGGKRLRMPFSCQNYGYIWVCVWLSARARELNESNTAPPTSGSEGH
jgi:hypothetical protein